MNFQTKISYKEIFIYDDTDDDAEWDKSDVVVNWSLDFEQRAWGIAGFDVIVSSINGSISNYDNEIDFSAFDIVVPMDMLKFNDRLAPVSLDVYVDKKTIEVNFN